MEEKNMKTKILDKTGKPGKEMDLPSAFSTKIRKDILLKVFEAEKWSLMQPWGAKPGAGSQYSASGIIRHRRNVWKTGYGKGISRIPRKIMSRHGVSFNWVGATVSSTRGGRKPSAPKSGKKLTRKTNRKEMVLAMKIALAGTVDKKSLEDKYKVSINPLIFNDAVLEQKTKDFVKMLENVFGEAFEKVMKKKTVRAGVGKTRGRKYKSNAGMLFVVGSKEKMKRKGIDVVSVADLRISDLAPNGVPGRFTAYTENAIKDLEELK